MIRGIIESNFVLSYSMSCYSIVFYFSIMYYWQKLDNTIFKKAEDARLFAPLFIVTIPHALAMIEYSVDTVSINNYQNWGQLPSINQFGYGTTSFIIVITYVFFNYVIQKYIFDPK